MKFAITMIVIVGAIVTLGMWSDNRRAIDAKLLYGFDTFLMEVRAYCPCEICCGEYADGITASEYVIQYGDRFVAAPPEIPFNTRMRIPHYNADHPVMVKDRGGDVYDNRLEVFFDTHWQAKQWGVQILQVEIER